MTRRWAVLLFPLLAGCATIPTAPLQTPPLPVLQESLDEGSAPAPPLPAEERQRLMDSEPVWVEGNPVQVSKKAEKLATMKPALAGFDRGMLVYPFRPYGVYWAGVPANGGLHIQLEPGEVIRLVANYRESDWLVQRDDATTPLEVSHITVTPKQDHVTGRLTLITTWGVRYLALQSLETEGLYAISWSHPVRVSR